MRTFETLVSGGADFKSRSKLFLGDCIFQLNLPGRCAVVSFSVLEIRTYNLLEDMENPDYLAVLIQQTST